MSQVVSPANRIAAALRTPGGGVIALVDALVEATDAPIHLAWAGDSCAVRHAGGETTAPLSRSAFRAVLARVAVLCNETAPGTVSPYGGAGVIVVGPRRVGAEFVNTMHDQRLTLAPA